MSGDVHDTARTRLREQDQRYTRNCRAIVSALLEADRPLSIPELLTAQKGLPQSSAYRSVSVLEQAGIVRRIVGGGEFTYYELAEDLTEHHHHFICSSCGGVEDFTLPSELEVAVEQALQRVARRIRSQGAHHRLDLIGVCASCR
jgi:Fur family transcriptional regulator, ferric uptake regulator